MRTSTTFNYQLQLTSLQIELNTMLRLFVTILITTFIIMDISAQNGHIHCTTHSLSNQEMASNPDAFKAQQDLKRFTEEYLKTHTNKSGAVNLVIPTVVHIIHENGPENVSDANVYDAIRILNEDFQKLNADTTAVASTFANLIGQTNFEFRLATIDPNGNCTNGITRTVDPWTRSGDTGPRPIYWDRSKYLNIWVVRVANGAGGYTWLPGTSPGANRDGVVVLYTQFGSLPPSGGGLSARTLSHEVGHWFNLPHPWGFTNTPGLPSNCNTDDGVADTPNTIGGGACNLTRVSCGSIDNVQNIMDYGSCPMMFTIGQAARMNASANSSIASRNNLWTTSNLLATGTDDATFNNPPTCAPIADFYAPIRSTCAGNSINLFDQSYNATFDSTWTYLWEFPGGTPATSTDRNPTVSYALPGTYQVRLTVTNSAGSSLTEVKNNYITATPGSGSFIAPYVESATLQEFPNNNNDATLEWTIERPSGSLWQFIRATNAFYSPPASIYLNNYSYNGTGTHELTSPIADLSNLVADSAFFNFQIAYQKKANEVELLEFYVSTNCGETWTREKFWFGNQLTSVSGSNPNPFTPTDSSEWRHISYPIGRYAGLPNVQFSLRWKSSNGNNVYFDDIAISKTPDPQPFVTSLDLFSENNFNIYPNPNNGVFKAEFFWNGKSDLSVELIDLMGKKRILDVKSNIRAGWNSIEIDAVTLGAESGFYILRMQNGNSYIDKKIIIE
jgi:PKD repeat protein